MFKTNEEFCQNFHDTVFTTIISSKDTNYSIVMPRRHGKTTLLKRIANYYFKKGYSIVVETICTRNFNNNWSNFEKYDGNRKEWKNTILIADDIDYFNPINDAIVIKSYTKRNSHLATGRIFIIEELPYTNGDIDIEYLKKPDEFHDDYIKRIKEKIKK